MKAEDLKGMNGRKVLVEGVIDDIRPDGGCGVLVRIADPFGLQKVASVSEASIVKIFPEEIKVGDFVTGRGGDERVARVEHIKGGWAWLFSAHSNSGDLRSLSDLTLVERGQ